MYLTTQEFSKRFFTIGKRSALAAMTSLFLLAQMPAKGLAAMEATAAANAAGSSTLEAPDFHSVTEVSRTTVFHDVLALQQTQFSQVMDGADPIDNMANDIAEDVTEEEPGEIVPEKIEAVEEGEGVVEIAPPEEAERAKAKQNINDITPPVIEYDFDKLPVPVRNMRKLLLEAAKSGDIEKLRPYIGKGDDQTMLSLGELDGDPIEFLRKSSGDEQGYEILAILSEVMETGYVVLDKGSENERYVWPYFFAWPLDKLTPAQKVDLFRLVTFGDYQDMEEFGAYIFYRVGITPQGRWSFFVSGD